MKKIWLAALGMVALVGMGYAITVNPASSVTADSEATAFTIAYRDSTGSFSVGSMTFGGAAMFAAKTKAQFDAYDPTVAGEVFRCSDCTEKLLCISTGTAIGDFQRMDSPTAGCGTGE